MPRPGVGLALGIAGAIAISLTNVFSRAHFDAGSTPETFLLGRYVLFVVPLSVWMLWRGALRNLERHQVLDLAIAGVLNVFGATCLAFAIERMTVGLAVIVLYLFPFFTLLLGALIERRAPQPITVVGLAVAFAGLVLALDVRGEPPDPVGIGFALAAAAGIAGSFVWIERRLEALGDIVRIYGIAVVGLVAAVVLGASSDNLVWPLPDPDGWSTLLIATATFAAASSAMFMAVSRIGATATALLMNLEPPATVLFAALLLGDRLRPLQLAGIALVVVAVASTQWLIHRSARP